MMDGGTVCGKARRKMALLVFLVIWGFLATTPLGSTNFQENESAGIHLALHHINNNGSGKGDDALPLSVLDQDEARVGALNFRLTRKQQTMMSNSKIPLHPGKSIGTGNYYVSVGLGTPPKPYSMVVDTGSSFNWVQCQPCRIYCHPQLGSVFDPSASTTYKLLSCNTQECSALEAATLNPPSCSKAKVCLYDASYGDSSYSVGYLSRDTLTLVEGQQQLLGFVYGCGQDNEGLFGRSAGLIGLARNKLSLLTQLSTKYGYAFSYCLPTSTSTSAGTLSFGSINYKIHSFTPMLTDPRDPTLYFLRMTAISVAGKPLPLSPAHYSASPTIIDSGTVITRLSTTVYTALKQAFLRAVAAQRAPPYSILDTCFKGITPLSAVPQVSLIFQGGAELKLLPANVLLPVGKGVSCLAFAGDSATNGVSIIGNTQQQTFSVAYDVANSRIGFAARACS